MKKIFLLLLVFTFTLLSHPHEFVDTKLKISYNKKGIDFVEVSWYFDEITSVMIMEDFDKNGNQKFEADEVKTAERDGFEVLKEINYYAFAKINGSIFKPVSHSDFSISVENFRVVYKFKILNSYIIKEGLNSFSVYFGDNENYTAFFLKKDDINFMPDKNLIDKIDIGENNSGTFVYDELRLNFKQEK